MFKKFKTPVKVGRDYLDKQPNRRLFNIENSKSRFLNKELLLQDILVTDFKDDKLNVVDASKLSQVDLVVLPTKQPMNLSLAFP